jgi:hypothetical protein
MAIGKLRDKQERGGLMVEYIEMLEMGDDGHAVEGTKYPYDLSAVQWIADDGNIDVDARIAYKHKFFKLDDQGHPIPETLVAFFVPDYLCCGSEPSDLALRLVAERMGWHGNR